MSDRYGRTVVLRSIDLDVPGGVTALLGPNGAGKTTLLHLVCGLRTPSAGSLTVMGVDATRRTARRAIAQHVGFLPQTFGYLPSYSVRDFVTYAAWLKKVPPDDRVGRVAAAISDVGLGDRASRALRTLSGGMLRRVGIAAAIVHRPALLVLDEPSAGLDPQQRIELRRLLIGIGRQTSVILSTHLIEDVHSTCDTVIVLDDGIVRFAGPPIELERAHLGCNRSDDSPSIEEGYLAVLERGGRCASV
jgi:ABC-2 type transport system ATP-binding protein